MSQPMRFIFNSQRLIMTEVQITTDI